jgi:chitinase
VVNEYLSRGAPPKEIVLGAPFYSRGWTGVPPGPNHGLYQSSTGAAPGTFEAGVDDYKVAKEKLASGFTRYYDAAAGAAWLYDGTSFWTFDDPAIMSAKAEYVSRNRLGGIMFWELSGDTPNGELISAIASGL